MTSKTTLKTIKENLVTRVYAEADVIVVGGGPGGHSAAIAAARSGAKTILVERYGHLGGMASGGIVIQIPHMSDGGKDPVIAGLSLEWLERLDKVGGTLRPRIADIGSNDEKLLKYWRRFFGNVINNHIEHTAWVDPELLKCVLNDMVEEAGVKLLLHSWGVRALTAQRQVTGVVFESKSGRQAITGKIIIDGTGDGDLFSSAGAAYDDYLEPKARSAMLALVFRLGNCDYQKYCDFREQNPEKAKELMEGLTKAAGTMLLPLPSPRNDVMWFNNWIPDLVCTKVEDLTKLEVEMRKKMLKGHAYLKKNFPTFENSFVLDTASQTGTRGSRRLTGEYVITREDFQNSKKFDDTIAVFPRLGPPGVADVKRVYIPYRALVPEKVDGFLAAGRSFSSDFHANNIANLIPHCIAMGQAAGTAAAMAVKQDIPVRKVNITTLQKNLLKEGVVLPGIDVK